MHEFWRGQAGTKIHYSKNCRVTGQMSKLEPVYGDIAESQLAFTGYCSLCFPVDGQMGMVKWLIQNTDICDAAIARITGQTEHNVELLR